MGGKTLGIQKNGVTAWRQNDGDAQGGQMITQISDCRVTVNLVIQFKRLFQSHGNGFKIPAGQPAIRRKSLPENQQIAELLGPDVVVAGQKTADIGQSVFLATHGCAISQSKHLPGDLQQGFVRVPGLALVNEKCIFRKPECFR